MLIGTGELMEQVINKSKDLNIYNKIMFLGVKENVNEYYQAMDIFILPSKFEGLPIVGVEAQASGLKCIFSENVTKEVNITNNSVFISTDNKEAWRSTILDLYQKGYDRQNEKENVEKSGYDLTEEIKKIEKIYLNYWRNK